MRTTTTIMNKSIDRYIIPSFNIGMVVCFLFPGAMLDAYVLNSIKVTNSIMITRAAEFSSI